MKQDTTIVTTGRDPAANHGVVNAPVYHASTITFPTVTALEEAGRLRFDPGKTYYGRYGTPTTFGFEESVAALEGGYRTVTTGSGKAAIVAALSAFLKAGDHLLMVDTTYGPTRAFCDKFLTRYGIETTYYDPLIGAGIADLIRPETKVVFTESPGSQTFEVQDVPAIATAAHDADCVVMIDNTWASPLYFKPFAHGCDISIQAATKYIVGHSDAMMGTITTTEAVHDKVRRMAFELGAAAGPDDVYLAQRGLRTIAVRLERHMKSALAIAEWLRKRPQVDRVLHPAIAGDPGHDLWKRDFEGASGLFGVILKDTPKAAVAAMLDGMDLFAMGYSWGGYESLIIPTDPGPMRTASKWTAAGPSLRLHIGLEDIGDLITDLEAGFARLNAAR